MYSAKKTQSKRRLIIAHRGASGEAPENTISAFDLAFEQGADGIELDVRLSRDRIPVVIHDANLTRTASIDAPVSALSWEEIRAIRLLNRFDSRHDHQSPPALRDVLEKYGGCGEIHIELKCGAIRDAAELGGAVSRLLRRVVRERRIDPSSIWISSFFHAALVMMRVLAGAFPRALIVTNRATNPFFRVPRFEGLIRPAGIDAAWEAIMLPGAERWIGRRRQLAAWPMDDPDVMNHPRFEWVDRIITNHPRLWIERKKEFAFDGSI